MAQESVSALPDGFAVRDGIVQTLPHRFPFLLVDAVTSLVPGSEIVGIKCVSKSDPNIRRGEGMSPLLVIEALAQLSVLLAFETIRAPHGEEQLTFFAAIEEARFGVPIQTGDRILLRSSVLKVRQSMGWFVARASVQDNEVVHVRMIAAIKAAPKS